MTFRTALTGSLYKRVSANMPIGFASSLIYGLSKTLVLTTSQSAYATDQLRYHSNALQLRHLVSRCEHTSWVYD